MGTYYQDEHQDVVRRANLSEAPWNTTIVVHTWHRFLREVLCNPGVAESGLFPPDQLEAQRARGAASDRPATSTGRIAAKSSSDTVATPPRPRITSRRLRGRG